MAIAMNGRNLLILNQEANYLTTGLANAFIGRFDSVTLVVGVLHPQGEAMDRRIQVVKINPMQEQSGWKRAGSYLIALFRMWWLLVTRFRKHEVLFVSVPPMGYLLNLVVSHRFSMVIWDLYPDVLKVKGMSETHPVYRIWSWLNRRSFRRAYRIFTISDVLAKAIGRYVDQRKLLVLPIWSMSHQSPRISRDQNTFIKQYGLEEKFVVQYSGNIGLTHNVEVLINIAERLKAHSDILFQIIGRGPRFPVIVQLIQELKLSNMQCLPFQSQEMFPYSISAADLGIVVLDEKVSSGSVPSKAYNLMSFGVPCIYISSPDSQLAVDAARLGHARCFSSEQEPEIAESIIQLYKDRSSLQVMSDAARNAASYYSPENAKLFADSYFATASG